MNPGKRMRAAREALGISQAELGRRIGCSANSVCLWENGKRDPGLKGLARIAAALGVTPASLLAEDAQAPLVPRDALRALAEDAEAVGRVLRALAAEGEAGP